MWLPLHSSNIKARIRSASRRSFIISGMKDTARMHCVWVADTDNLLSNAFKFTAGGEVSMDIEGKEKGRMSFLFSDMVITDTV